MFKKLMELEAFDRQQADAERRQLWDESTEISPAVTIRPSYAYLPAMGALEGYYEGYFRDYGRIFGGGVTITAQGPTLREMIRTFEAEAKRLLGPKCEVIWDP